MRLDHAAITSLLALPPDASLIKVLWYILNRHDLAEEEAVGMYDIGASRTENETQALLDQLSKVSEVPVHPPNASAYAYEAAKRSLARAGYDFDSIISQK